MNCFEVIRIVKALYSGFEQLKDPAERSVFEAIFNSHGKLATVNYDALRQLDFDRADGHVSPSIDELVEALSSKLSKEEVRKALNSLDGRKIIGERNSRWHVRF